MAGYGYGQSPPGAYGAPGQPVYGAPPGQPGYGVPPGQLGYGAPPGQPGYGAPPGQAPYGTPQGQASYGVPQHAQPGYGTLSYGAPPGQPAYGAPYGAPGMALPGVDPEVQQWFIAVDTDRSGKISAIELQQALTNANWSHFNAETCRLMIGMFDRDQNGTIDLMEFLSLWKYIQQWRTVFQQFDRDRSGGIEAAELHAAFAQMGYNLSMNFVSMVVCRFDVNGRRQLTLDNFIQASVMLKSITDTFRQCDTTMAGTMRLTYEDFMTVAMLNKP